MLLSATLSKPAKKSPSSTDFLRVKIKLSSSSNLEQGTYLAEFYTKTQVFHKKMSSQEVTQFIEENVPENFKSCVERTLTEEITVMANKKGKVTRLVKKIHSAPAGVVPAKAVPEQSAGMSRGRRRSTEDAVEPAMTPAVTPLAGLLRGSTENFSFQEAAGSRRPNSPQNSFNRSKNYILPEGCAVPFLVRLGIMTAEGKVIAAKYHKFRQINRFLEIFRDCAMEVLKQKGGGELQVVDFGSGKSYLTFAVHYFLTEILKVPCRIFGLDLKKDVIDYCSALSLELGLKNLTFAVGDIAEFAEDRSPDIVITLHACDTATDFALNYAVKKGALGILSVPCCQHEINSQLKKHFSGEDGIFEPLLKYGLIKERFSALVTDALRGELLEQAGYRVQMLEFIDDQGTPKNLMIRAVRKGKSLEKGESTIEGADTGVKASTVEGADTGVKTSTDKGADSDKAASTVEGGGAKKSSCRILQELGVRQTLQELLSSPISE